MRLGWWNADCGDWWGWCDLVWYGGIVANNHNNANDENNNNNHNNDNHQR